ncbi:MAG: prepilin-type N-terminal cleavage/methylation domain-containing protein, partial [Syntrophorhabdaceae bacterium]|nr:prepilin-type N-terminal cleavage/methylation domain-containing protein [Syntrophorhabdaceae bacterium]
MIKVQRNSKGFTLIELLIVIAIIGILAAIAIPAYTGYTKKSKVSGIVNAMGAAKNALAAYFTENSSATLALDYANIAGNIGVSLPDQYINSTGTQINATDSNNIVITVNAKGIGSGVDGTLL